MVARSPDWETIPMAQGGDKPAWPLPSVTLSVKVAVIALQAVVTSAEMTPFALGCKLTTTPFRVALEASLICTVRTPGAVTTSATLAITAANGVVVPATRASGTGIMLGGASPLP